jgi:hypothetical protein
MLLYITGLNKDLMKTALHATLFFLGYLFLTTHLHAQTIDTIVGFDEIPPPELATENILIDDFDIYYGSTASFTASENAGWCAAIENDQYVSFRAGSSGAVTFELTSFDCTSGNGLEVAIYDIHNQVVGDCFTSDQQVYSANNLVSGLVYYIRLDGVSGSACAFNLRFISGVNTGVTPPSTYIGRDTLCTAGCVFAPTGETITCNSGLYAFEASNDTTYYGELFLDNFEALELEPFSFTFSGSPCEGFVDLSWTGSTFPFNLNGEILQNSFAQLGPFSNGDTINIVLSGASPCVDPLVDALIFSCASSTVSVQSLGFEVVQLNASLLQISAPSYGWELSIVDMLGREVLASSLGQDANQLFVGDLLRGTYFIVVQNGKERATEKWVKR